MDVRIAVVICLAQLVPCFFCFFAVFIEHTRVPKWIWFAAIILVLAFSVFITRIYFTPDSSFYNIRGGLTFIFLLFVIAAALFCIQDNYFTNLFVLCFLTNYNDYIQLLAKIFNIVWKNRIGFFNPSADYAITIVLLELAAFPFLFWFMQKIIKPVIEQTSAMRAWRYLWIIPISFYCIFRIGLFPTFSDACLVWHNSLFLLPVAWIIGTIMTYYIVMRTLLESFTNSRLQSQLSVMDLQIELQKEQYEQLQKNIESTRAARHDLRHNLLALKGYADQRDTDGLLRYINHYLKILDTDEVTSFCENYAVDTILRHYYLLAHKSGIEAGITVNLPKELPVTEMDTCVVLGNLLENALEACLLQTKLHRFIHVSIGIAGKRMVAINVKNSYENEIRQEKGKFYSTKRAGEGIGLTSVRHIAEKHQGFAHFDYADHIFKVSVLLMPDSKSK